MAKTKKRNFHQGKYDVINKDRYMGTNTSPRYLSSWELQVFKYLDHKPGVIQWGAEVVVVPYMHPRKETMSRYIVDVYVEYTDADGTVQKEMIEIKPSAQCSQPKKTNRKRQDVYEQEVNAWVVNSAKWTAAQKYAKDRGIWFRVITEKDIFR
jgi:hypothetical protein